MTLDKYVGEVSAHVARTTGYKYIRSKLLTDYVKRLQLVEPRGREQRLPFPINKAFVAALVDDASVSLALRVCPLIAFHGLLRSSEYLASHRTPDKVNLATTLLRSDVRYDAGQRLFAVRIKSSKGDVTGTGPERHFVEVPGDPYCPVANLRAYLLWFDRFFPPDTPLFRHDDGRYVIREDLSRQLKRHARRLGIPEDQVAPHCLRHGGAFELAEAGVPWDDITILGRWSIEYSRHLAVHYAKFSYKRAAAAAEALRIGGTAAGVVLMTRH